MNAKENHEVVVQGLIRQTEAQRRVITALRTRIPPKTRDSMMAILERREREAYEIGFADGSVDKSVVESIAVADAVCLQGEVDELRDALESVLPLAESWVEGRKGHPGHETIAAAKLKLKVPA